MRHITYSIALAVAALTCVLAQTKEPAYPQGEVEELRGISRLFVSMATPDAISRDRIIKAVRERAPHLTFVSTPEEADVWLWFSMSWVTETNRGAANPSAERTGPPSVAYESIQVASGQIIAAPGRSHPGPKVVARFRRRGGDGKGLCEAFAKEFIRAYRKANSGEEISPGDRPRAVTAPPRLSKGEIAPPAPSDGRSQAPPAGTREGGDEDDVVSVTSTLVTIPASVVGRDGKYVTNLRKEDFHVYEDGVEQDISFFAAVDAPFTVALLIDTSTSTRASLKDIVAAANAFVDQLRPGDRLMVISFDLEVRELVKVTEVRDVRNQGINISTHGGATRLFDAVDFAVNERLKHVAGRKAIVLLTDGVDGGSIMGHEQSISDVEESDILIYPVLYDTYEETIRQIKAAVPGATPPAKQIRKLYERGNKYLSDLARLTGGRLHQVDGVGDIAQAFASVVGELGRQYSLGYYPRNPPKEGQRRQIKVRVGLPNLAVRAKDSYVVTSPGAGKQ